MVHALVHLTIWNATPTARAAAKKNANATSADRSAVFAGLPRKFQLPLYSWYEIANAHAAASAPKTTPRSALSWIRT